MKYQNRLDLRSCVYSTLCSSDLAWSSRLSTNLWAVAYGEHYERFRQKYKPTDRSVEKRIGVQRSRKIRHSSRRPWALLRNLTSLAGEIRAFTRGLYLVGPRSQGLELQPTAPTIDSPLRHLPSASSIGPPIAIFETEIEDAEGEDMSRFAGRHSWVCGFLLAAVLCAEATPAESAAKAIVGQIQTVDGRVVEQARVSAPDQGLEVYTDAKGRFALDGCRRPCLLLVTHPRFQAESITVPATTDSEAESGGVHIQLTAKQEIFERIDVTAGRSSGDAFAPETVASTEIRLEDKAYAPSSLAEMVEGVAGVAENGQPGLFQVYSVRGVSRHRVMTLISGMQIVGERRAGVATSFVDPTLMGAVEVLRGPASTYYGSGALGGVVQVFPKEFERLEVDLAWNSFGDENVQTVGWGQDGWSIGIARRDAGNDDVSDGSPQDTHFTQISAAVRKTWERAGRTWEVLVMPSLGDDIGKPNTDFPDSRITEYPEEEHLLVKVGVRDDAGWSAHAFVHPNSLITETLRIGSRLNVVENEAFDLGANAQREWDLGSGAHVLAGADYFGRRGVTADELERRFSDDASADEITLLRTLDDAGQDELSAYGSLRWSWGAASLQAGARLTWQEQQNGSAPARDDTAWTGFLGFVRPVGSGFELTANLGTGLRFPNLSERFFTGTTGRGGTVGNPDLEAERSTNVDLGLRWFGERAFLAAQVFHLEIDDYIERIEIEDDVLTFVNLTSGSIEGFEIEGFYQLSDQWLLEASGHVIDGESETGDPLADISPDRLQLGLRYSGERFGGKVQWQYRAAKDDPGGGEVAISSANVVSASLSYDLSTSVSLTVRAKNLLDETYFSSADDKTSAAPGRSVGVGVSWRPSR